MLLNYIGTCCQRYKTFFVTDAVDNYIVVVSLAARLGMQLDKSNDIIKVLKLTI
jgi:hypothetical protein